MTVVSGGAINGRSGRRRSGALPRSGVRGRIAGGGGGGAFLGAGLLSVLLFLLIVVGDRRRVAALERQASVVRTPASSLRTTASAAPAAEPADDACSRRNAASAPRRAATASISSSWRTSGEPANAPAGSARHSTVMARRAFVGLRSRGVFVRGSWVAAAPSKRATKSSRTFEILSAANSLSAPRQRTRRSSRSIGLARRVSAGARNLTGMPRRAWAIVPPTPSRNQHHRRQSSRDVMKRPRPRSTWSGAASRRSRDAPRAGGG